MWRNKDELVHRSIHRRSCKTAPDAPNGELQPRTPLSSARIGNRRRPSHTAGRPCLGRGLATCDQIAPATLPGTRGVDQQSRALPWPSRHWPEVGTSCCSSRCCPSAPDRHTPDIADLGAAQCHRGAVPRTCCCRTWPFGDAGERTQPDSIHMVAAWAVPDDSGA